MRYRLKYTEEARQDLHRLPGFYWQRIRRLIESLAENPRPGVAKELRDRPDRYRIRVDDWRMGLYEMSLRWAKDRQIL